MTVVNDSRKDSTADNSGSRRKFLERNRDYIKKAVEKAINERGLTDIGEKGIDVPIPRRDVTEPSIHHGRGGTNERVFPGNKQYQAGDQIERPRGGGGGGGGGPGAGSGKGEDDFIYQMTAEDFKNYIFNDLELPNNIKQTLSDSKKTKLKRSGFSSVGKEQDRDLVRSKKEKMKRIIGTVGSANDEIIILLEKEKAILSKFDAHQNVAIKELKSWKPKSVIIDALKRDVATLKERHEHQLLQADRLTVAKIDDQIEALESKKALVPYFNESTDSRYRNSVQKPIPTSKSVMFCLMDVSGSMDQATKNNAKMFYYLLYLFLQQHYEQVDIVFIRHHTEADEVDAKTFFYDRSTGGTIVSTALDKMIEIMKARYPASEWNIYGAQASDGDNIESDNPKCAKLLTEILGKAQGYFYTEITPGKHQNLWNTYAALAPKHQENFWMAHIKDRKEVLNVFREFFKKRDGAGSAPNHYISAFNPN